jgi:ubiquinone biosynthesis accessory factor UbiJ
LIRTFTWLAIENAINTYLYLDPETLQRLALLKDKVIKIKLTDWRIHFYLIPQHEGVHLRAIYQGPIDCIITGSSFDLLRAARSEPDAVHKIQAIEIEGDVELGQTFQQIMRDSKINWEEYLSHIIGDAAAHGLGRFAKGFKQWRKEAVHHLQRNISEYLQEEIRYFPPRAEIEDFFADIRLLADAVERFEKRLQCVE